MLAISQSKVICSSRPLRGHCCKDFRINHHRKSFAGHNGQHSINLCTAFLASEIRKNCKLWFNRQLLQQELEDYDPERTELPWPGWEIQRSLQSDIDWFLAHKWDAPPYIFTNPILKGFVGYLFTTNIFKLSWRVMFWGTNTDLHGVLKGNSQGLYFFLK